MLLKEHLPLHSQDLRILRAYETCRSGPSCVKCLIRYGHNKLYSFDRVYRPPEANADESQIYMPTTDIYSFAIILVEIGGRTEISPPVSSIVVIEAKSLFNFHVYSISLPPSLFLTLSLSFSFSLPVSFTHTTSNLVVISCAYIEF